MESEHYFFDTEVFPNLFIICYKKQGEEQIHQMAKTILLRLLKIL